MVVTCATPPGQLVNIKKADVVPTPSVCLLFLLVSLSLSLSLSLPLFVSLCLSPCLCECVFDNQHWGMFFVLLLLLLILNTFE